MTPRRSDMGHGLTLTLVDLIDNFRVGARCRLQPGPRDDFRRIRVRMHVCEIARLGDHARYDLPERVHGARDPAAGIGDRTAIVCGNRPDILLFSLNRARGFDPERYSTAPLLGLLRALGAMAIPRVRKAPDRHAELPGVGEDYAARRRFTICPNCRVIGAPVPTGADRYTCRHCHCEFKVTEVAREQ